MGPTMDKRGRLYVDGELVGHISDAPPGVAEFIDALLAEREEILDRP